MIRCNNCQKPIDECACIKKDKDPLSYETKVVEVDEIKDDKLEKATLTQLKAMAKEKGIKGYYKMKSNELIEALRQY